MVYCTRDHDTHGRALGASAEKERCATGSESAAGVAGGGLCDGHVLRAGSSRGRTIPELALQANDLGLSCASQGADGEA